MGVFGLPVLFFEIFDYRLRQSEYAKEKRKKNQWFKIKHLEK